LAAPFSVRSISWKNSAVVNVCDAELVGKTLSEGNLKMHISKDFFGGELVEEDEVVKIIRDSAILSLANWVGNVILPVYGGIEIVRAVLGVGGFFERLNIGDDWIRHFIAGGACLCVSGLMRLMEHFIAAGTSGVA